MNPFNQRLSSCNTCENNYADKDQPPPKHAPNLEAFSLVSTLSEQNPSSNGGALFLLAAILYL
jgi:hypothetical protein